MESVAHGLVTRARRCGYYRGRYYNCNTRNTRWSSWGRWVLAGVALFLFLVVVMSLCCLARRRKKRGVKPFYGTGWMAPAGKAGGGGGHNGHSMGGRQSGYNANNGGYYNNNGMNNHGTNPDYGAGQTFNAPPAYGANEPQHTGTATFNEQDGYYGSNGQYNSSVQSPPSAYQRDGFYPPPPGAPPK